MLTLNFRDFAAYPSEATAGSYAEAGVAIEPTNTERESGISRRRKLQCQRQNI